MIAYGVLVRPDDGRVLLVADGDGWTLPSVTLAEGDDHADLGPIRRAFEERLGSRVDVLRPAAWVRGSGVYELDGGGGSGSWRAAGDIADPELSAVAVAVGGHRTDPHPNRRPWERPGWMPVVVAWIDAELDAIGVRRTNVELTRSWSISAVVRVETTAGPMYAKAVPPIFAAEPTITAALASRFPGVVPDVVAADPDRGLLLMREVASSTDTTPEQSLRLLATMQCELASDPGFVVSAGCADRPTASLVEDVRELVDDPLTAELVPPADVAELGRLEASIEESCHELASCGIPHTLVHGDFHDGNVMASGAIIDWTDAALSHPFFDLPTWFSFKRVEDQDPDVRLRALDLYLGPWRERYPDAALTHAVDLAGRLGLLYHAVSYLRIVRATEPASRWQLQSMVPGLVGRFTGSRYRDR